MDFSRFHYSQAVGAGKTFHKYMQALSMYIYIYVSQPVALCTYGRIVCETQFAWDRGQLGYRLNLLPTVGNLLANGTSSSGKSHSENIDRCLLVQYRGRKIIVQKYFRLPSLGMILFSLQLNGRMIPCQRYVFTNLPSKCIMRYGWSRKQEYIVSYKA